MSASIKENPKQGGERESFLHDLATRISSIPATHPLRVAIDGVDTSGKTTLADELIEPLTKLGRPVIRASIDRFHRPRKERYQRGKDSPEGYYFNSFNHQALIQELLQPLGPNGNLSYRTEVFDFRTDSELTQGQEVAPANAILLFDGVFLLRPELYDYWDVRIFLQVPFEKVLERASIRDAGLLGDVQEVERRYQIRYIPGQQLYLNAVHPEQKADIVVDNSDFNKPLIISNK